MRKFLTLLALLMLVHLPAVNAVAAESHPEVISIRDINIQPFEEAVKGFETVFTTPIVHIDLSEDRMTDLGAYLKDRKPHLLLAIGTDSLTRVRGVKDIPVIYLMVLNPASGLDQEPNITGVSMNIAQEKQLSILSQLLPEIKRIGIIYDPQRSTRFVERAEAAALKKGIALIAKPISHSKEVTAKAMELKGEIDLLWMMPDISVVTPDTVKYLLYFSFQNRVPILTFSEKYVKMGALVSIGMDPFDIGIQAGEMARAVMAGNAPETISRTDARKAVVTINAKIARKFGLQINTDSLPNVRAIQ